MRSKLRAGFSLIEVALALLVVSVGLVAVIGMLPGSLDNSKKASDNTQVSLFADYVLNTLRAYASNTNVLWTSIANGLKVQVAAPSMWDQPNNLVITAGDLAPKELVFRVANDPDLEEMTISCTLNIERNNPGPNMALATLKVVPAPKVAFTQYTNTFHAILYRGELP